AHAVREARHVDHVGHLLESLQRVADQPGERALQLDLAARHAARAELLLQAQEAIAVGRTVGQRAWQEKEGEAGGSARRAFRTGKNEGKTRIGIRAEPLVAV